MTEDQAHKLVRAQAENLILSKLDDFRREVDFKFDELNKTLTVHREASTARITVLEDRMKLIWGAICVIGTAAVYSIMEKVG